MISIKVPMTVPIVASVIVGAFFTSTAALAQEQDDAGLPYSLELGRAWSATHRDENGWTDLHYAAVLNRPDLARRLLDAGASMEARLVSDGDWFSVRLKETLEAFNFPIRSVFRMVSRAWGHRERRIWDATPLDLAIAAGSSDVAELLLNRGANLAERWYPNASVMPGTPLLGAVYSSSVEMVELLLNRGANLETGGNRGTPLWIAGSVEMVELLLDRGANFEPESSWNGDTLLHHEARRGDVRVVELLLNRGADIEAVNDDSETPLHCALDATLEEGLFDVGLDDGKMETLELLLNRGANIEAAGKYGRTPLHYAVRRLSVEAVELLLDRDANIEAVKSAGETPLHAAVRMDSTWGGTHLLSILAVVELLLNRGANIEAVNSDGHTPLDVATTSEVVDLLSNR